MPDAEKELCARCWGDGYIDHDLGREPCCEKGHGLRFPASSTLAGCTCGWEAEVPLGHSKTDAFLDHRTYVLPPGVGA